MLPAERCPVKSKETKLYIADLDTPPGRKSRPGTIPNPALQRYLGGLRPKASRRPSPFDSVGYGRLPVSHTTPPKCSGRGLPCIAARPDAESLMFSIDSFVL